MPQATFSANNNYKIDVDAAVQSQDRAGNFSIVYWRVVVHKTYGYGHMATTNLGNHGEVDSSVGQLWTNGNMAYDFRNGAMNGSWTIASGTFRVNHDGLGRGRYSVTGALNFYALGSAKATTGWRNLPTLATVPSPPRPISLAANSQHSMVYKFESNGDGGAPVREWQIGYGKNPNTPQAYLGSWGTTTIGALDPGTVYYAWSRGRNDIGWGPWSARKQTETSSGAVTKVGTQWKRTVPYIKVNGVWRLAQPYVKYKGVWRRTG